MPLRFYYTPDLVTTLRHYEPVAYSAALIDLYERIATPWMLCRRLATRTTTGLRILHALRTFGVQQDLIVLRRIHGLLADDPTMRAFHDGRHVPLPAYYQHEFDRRLGRYAALLTVEDRTPHLEPLRAAEPTGVHAPVGGRSIDDRVVGH